MLSSCYGSGKSSMSVVCAGRWRRRSAISAEKSRKKSLWSYCPVKSLLNITQRGVLLLFKAIRSREHHNDAALLPGLEHETDYIYPWTLIEGPQGEAERGRRSEFATSANLWFHSSLRPQSKQQCPITWFGESKAATEPKIKNESINKIELKLSRGENLLVNTLMDAVITQ